MKDYWSCSKFADWLRGTPKPTAETSTGWRDWTISAKIKHPFRYWISDNALDYIQWVIYSPSELLYSIKYYINNRWVSKAHQLTAHPRDMKPGHWHDVGFRFLPCLFNELVDFVEIETASMHVACDEAVREKYHAPFWASGWFRWRVWRCPEAGLAYLEWSMALKSDESWGLTQDHPDFGKPTQQAERAKEIKELYLWWKTVRVNRPDAHDASGWTARCEARRGKSGGDSIFSSLEDQTEKEREITKSLLDKLQEIELAYETEDTEMLIRLIRIRDSLWT